MIVLLVMSLAFIITLLYYFYIKACIIVVSFTYDITANKVVSRRLYCFSCMFFLGDSYVT